MIDIDDIKRLTLGPRDILVVKIDAFLTAEMVERIKSTISDGHPDLANKVMVVDKTISLAIVEQEPV